MTREARESYRLELPLASHFESPLDLPSPAFRRPFSSSNACKSLLKALKRLEEPSKTAEAPLKRLETP